MTRSSRVSFALLRTLAAGLLVCSSLVFSQRHKGASDDDSDDQGSKRNKTFTVTKGGTLHVDVSSGNVVITPTGSTQVEIHVASQDEDALDRLRISQSGNTVTVRNHSDDESEDDRYEISVPTEFDLDIRTSNGDLTVGSGLTGTITGATSAGNVHLGNLIGSADLNTSGGDMKALDIDGDLSLQTSGGNINVGEVTGAADLNTSGGDIDIGKVGKNLSALTSGGDVTFDNVGGEAHISTSGGTIHGGSVHSKAELRTAGGDITLEGASGIINASTAGGNLDLSGIVGSLNAHTSGGDITAELTPSGTGKSKLTSASGTIRLYVPEDARAEISAVIRVQGWWKSDEDDYHIRSDFKASSNDKDEDESEIRSSYLLNGGGESISLETVNADIDIRTLGAAHTKWKKK
jgi:DUF4097 and DUF4098 domain-containing protein YvlB